MSEKRIKASILSPWFTRAEERLKADDTDASYLERLQNIHADYNELFGSPVGRRVLKHMLVELGFFRQITDEEDRILHNYSLELLRHIGVWDPENSEELTAGVLKPPIARRLEGA